MFPRYKGSLYTIYQNSTQILFLIADRMTVKRLASNSQSQESKLFTIVTVLTLINIRLTQN